MKHFLVIGSMLAASAASAEVSDVRIFDHNKTVVIQDVRTETRCNDVKVPIYRESQSSGGDVLMGAILGGLLGGTASGSDGGAAVGALLGGALANESSNKQVAGYQLQRQCGDVRIIDDNPRTVYSHSTIRFYINGKRYVVPFQR